MIAVAKHTGMVCSSALQLLIGLHLASDTLRKPVELFLHSRLDIDEAAIKFHFGHSVQRFHSYAEISQSDAPRTLFVDSDVASLAPLWESTKSQIFVYEEGVGTYSSLTALSPGLLRSMKWTILDVLRGYSVRLGDSRCTSGVYVYWPHLFNSAWRRRVKSVFQIKGSLKTFIATRQEHLMSVFKLVLNLPKNNFADQDVIILLTDWSEVKAEDLDFAKREVNAKRKPLIVLKRHPRAPADTSDLFDVELPARIPLEMLLLDIMDANPSSVTVLHKGSSCVLYTGDWPIEFKLLPSTSRRVRQTILDVLDRFTVLRECRPPRSLRLDSPTKA